MSFIKGHDDEPTNFGDVTPPLRHPNSQRFHDLLKEIGELHDRKQADYGRGDDPFANVNGSSDWGIRPWVGAMLRATDKIRRLQKYAADGQLANEGARDSFLDLAVYDLIALVLWEIEQHDVGALPVRGCDGPADDATTMKMVQAWRSTSGGTSRPAAYCDCALNDPDPTHGHSFDCAIRIEQRLNMMGE
jgi:hypothetical protein